MVLITRDLGIGNLRTYPFGTHAGIVLIRFPMGTKHADLNAHIVSVLRLAPDDDLDGNITVIDPNKVRIRRKP
jgi:hypothetical protein